jgi:hypothetical protein
MAIDTARVRGYLQDGDLTSLFLDELGWDRYPGRPLTVTVGTGRWTLRGVAQKRDLAVLAVAPGPDGQAPDSATRRRIEREVAKVAHEHLLIFTDAAGTEQTWQWARREPGGPTAYREQRYTVGQSGTALGETLGALAFSLDEEERLDITAVTARVRGAFDVERVTKKFYERFKAEHGVFLTFIEGIAVQGDREWYASLMLNRLMFVYFIQKKGFLDGNRDYLRDRLRLIREGRGDGQFLSFYRYFLRRLFHEGLDLRVEARDAALERLLGTVPYLNGGLFAMHQLEEDNPDIDIPDDAFERVFAFFDEFRWRLDERPLRDDGEINPDVLGYIFEKYINQKQMGAYYTKEDITGYIGTNTIVPFLLGRATEDVAIAFEADGAAWRLLREHPDRYIHDAVLKGVDAPLPPDIAAGEHDVRARGGWNRPADPAVALPTETWREFMARRARCHDLRAKLAAGEVHAVDDLTTLNLNIRQFAHDIIAYSEGPEVVRALYRAIGRITVLDPTCGSGAFLFAALNILQPLYAACLDRMQAFVEDADRAAAGRNGQGARSHEDFRTTLKQVASHPNRAYFILKSIILDNLYGVDIMEEAVEICKLRLFLKLASQVEPERGKPNYGLEPLPDIDFNIRAGNTLIGFASYAAVAGSLRGGTQGKLDLFGDMPAIERRAQGVERAFAAFHDAQTRPDGAPALLGEAKRQLREELAALGGELDRYLAAEYGVDMAKAGDLAHWRAAYQPFHWFTEFHRIIAGGGFDVIVGNPPYIELRALTKYRTHGYSTEDSGNLYALVMERCFALRARNGRQGFIVPVSSISTDRYESLQQLLAQYQTHTSAYDDRPSRLFDGLEHIRLTIHLIGPRVHTPQLYSTRYHKWNAVERPTLFNLLHHVPSRASLVEGSVPKLSSGAEQSIIAKLSRQRQRLASSYSQQGRGQVYYSRKVGYFLQVLDFEPEVRNGRGERRPPSEFKALRFADEPTAKSALCCLNSNLFYWFVTVYSDCRHLNKREVDAFPVALATLADSASGLELVRLAGSLMDNLQEHSDHRKMKFKHDTLMVQHIFPKLSKPIIDQIDRVLAVHYGFSEEELDFIINYDIKYRMGREAEDDD